MTTVDLLSDTVYRDQARDRLDSLLDEIGTVPVKAAQLYGLRQIARQQPWKVKEFAQHQRKRAERRDPDSSEIRLWSLVEHLYGSTTDWSVRGETKKRLPMELRDENIPRKHPGMTPGDRRVRNQLRVRQSAWLDAHMMPHVTAFFERFCTHALYRREN